MIRSPMFNHAVESYQHGIEHYFEGSSRSRKFAVLHIDHAIELFVKEKMVSSGKSIYKSSGQTVSLHEALNSISKEVGLPERPRLEELHDLRNIIQHKGVLPDQATIDFYAKFSYQFVKKFCCNEFGLKVEEILPQVHISLFEAPEPPPLPDQVSNALHQARYAENNIDKVLGIYTSIELAAEYLAGYLGDDEKLKVKNVLSDNAISRGISENKFKNSFKYLNILRGKIMSSDYFPEDKEVDGYYNAARKVLTQAGFDV